jgi:hypothetical protein
MRGSPEMAVGASLGRRWTGCLWGYSRRGLRVGAHLALRGAWGRCLREASGGKTVGKGGKREACQISAHLQPMQLSNSSMQLYKGLLKRDEGGDKREWKMMEEGERRGQIMTKHAAKIKEGEDLRRFSPIHCVKSLCVLSTDCGRVCGIAACLHDHLGARRWRRCYRYASRPVLVCHDTSPSSSPARSSLVNIPHI